MSRRLLGALLAPAALLTSFALAPMAVADPGGGGSTGQPVSGWGPGN